MLQPALERIVMLTTMGKHLVKNVFKIISLKLGRPAGKIIAAGQITRQFHSCFLDKIQGLYTPCYWSGLTSGRVIYSVGKLNFMNNGLNNRRQWIFLNDVIICVLNTIHYI